MRIILNFNWISNCSSDYASLRLLLIRLELRLRSASAASRERLRRGSARFASRFKVLPVRASTIAGL